MEGSRPLLVEVQALVAPSELEQPRRVVSGLDRNRLALVLAILARHGRVGTGGADVFVNRVGGCGWMSRAATWRSPRGREREPRRADPECPTGVFRRARPDRRAALGGAPERRLQEAAKHGLDGVIAPVDSGAPACEVATLRDALALALPERSGEAKIRSISARPVAPTLA